MRAAVILEQGGELRIEELEPNALAATDVIVQVDASGVCHSDLSVLRGAVPATTPLVLGHEGAGTVLEVGPGVTRVAVGDRVIAAVVPTCGRCWYCVRDETHRCEAAPTIVARSRARRRDGTAVRGFVGLGSFADVMVVDETSLVPVDTDLPAEQLALIGCGVSTGVGAVLNTARVAPGSTVAVIGLGGVGQSVVQGARIAGAARILAVDPVDLKRRTAVSFGATDVVDPAAGDPAEQVHDLTGGRGVDAAFEVVGRPETILQAWAMARRGGMVVVVGMAAATATVTFGALDLLATDRTIVGSRFGGTRIRRDFPRLVELAETRRLDLAGMVTRRIRLEDVAASLSALECGEVIRSVMTPTQTDSVQQHGGGRLSCSGSPPSDAAGFSRAASSGGVSPAAHAFQRLEESQ